MLPRHLFSNNLNIISAPEQVFLPPRDCNPITTPTVPVDQLDGPEVVRDQLPAPEEVGRSQSDGVTLMVPKALIHTTSLASSLQIRNSKTKWRVFKPKGIYAWTKLHTVYVYVVAQHRGKWGTIRFFMLAKGFTVLLGVPTWLIPLHQSLCATQHIA